MPLTLELRLGAAARLSMYQMFSRLLILSLSARRPVCRDPDGLLKMASAGVFFFFSPLFFSPAVNVSASARTRTAFARE